MYKGLYTKLAVTNIKKNFQTYFPYMLTGICTVMMFYMIVALSQNTGLLKMSNGESLKSMLGFGVWVVAIFSGIFLLYTNSYLIKRRKKEFGLFNILGMEKKHIAKILSLETLYVAIISIFAGLTLGIFLNKLVFLALLKILHFKVTLGFEISGSAIIATLVLFGSVYLLNLLINLTQIRFSKPIELLYGGNVGEKEPKTRWILAILGIISLGAGYYISLTTKNPIAALFSFFIAVVLVIIGTYFIFTAGSIAVLKLLRKKKSFYYKSGNFTSISGMLYRMKQNAVGLANICILSTMVLVTLSTTVCLYVGMEDVLSTRFSREVELVSYDASRETAVKMENSANDIMKAHKLVPQNPLQYRYAAFTGKEKGDTFNTENNSAGLYMNDSAKMLYFIPLEDYNHFQNDTQTLNKNQILIYSNRSDYAYGQVKLFGQTFMVKKNLQSFVDQGLDKAEIVGSYYIIVKDVSVLKDLHEKQQKLYGKNSSMLRNFYLFDINANDKLKLAVYKEIKLKMGDTVDYTDSKMSSKDNFFSLYGGLFFVGLFLGFLFIMATVLIIYYKQISEGYDDRSRFDIMQKVGMSRAEVKKSIRSQILIVFFLPLLTACIHIVFAFPAVTKILKVFSMTNSTLFAWVIVIIAVIFAGFYAIVYALTARTYYKIVS